MRKIIKKIKEVKEKTKTANSVNEKVITSSKAVSKTSGKNLDVHQQADERERAKIWAEAAGKRFR